MYELKKNGKVFTSKFVGTGLSSFEKRIYRAAVSQRLRNTAVEGCVGHAVQRQVANSAGRNWNRAAPRSGCQVLLLFLLFLRFSSLSMYISLLTLLTFSRQKDLKAAVGVNELTVQYTCTCECYNITEWVRRLQSPLASNKTCVVNTITTK